MKIPRSVWETRRAAKGDFIARQQLGCHSKPAKWDAMIRERHTRRDPLVMVYEMAHLPPLSPIENRKKYAIFIRKLITQSRAHRLTILSYCAPGVPRQFLP